VKKQRGLSLIHVFGIIVFGGIALLMLFGKRDDGTTGVGRITGNTPAPKPHANIESPQQPANNTGEKQLHVPSDPKATFFVLERGGKGAERTIVTKRVGPSGTTYSRRLYNCTNNTVKYLGSGETLSDMNSSKPDPSMVPIVEGAIAYYVGLEACK
jgi:hypothetical protein